MTWMDWIILAILIASVIGGLAQGFFRTVFSLAGLIFGLAIAAWNYWRVAPWFKPAVKIDAVASAIGFLLIVLLVMALANVVGNILAKTMHRIGLGCVDTLAGGVFGLVQGALLVMIFILVTLAFFPSAHWLTQGRLPRMFFGACHLSTHVTPGELSDRVRNGLKLLEHESPEWMHSAPNGVSD